MQMRTRGDEKTQSKLFLSVLAIAHHVQFHFSFFLFLVLTVAVERERDFQLDNAEFIEFRSWIEI